MLSLVALLAASTTVLGATLPASTTATPATACTTGTPTTTAGFPISFYVKATPASSSFAQGYEPEPAWASQHLVGTNTFGVPDPVESGFAYAQFKCQYYCDDKSQGGSFFVRADGDVGSYCSCYDKLIDPKAFVNSNQTLVGAWNSICTD
ncbi:hypothetical protein F4861DRAFT_109041 [Xylaria intraflava]|nr:hypothetical protein F4861DRAFT_109041 [Xylaria intraflava]